MPFLRRTALARSRCFSGSQKVLSQPGLPRPAASQALSGGRWLHLKPLPLWGQDHGTPGPKPWPQQPAPAETLMQTAALTKLSLNGRCARHHVRSPLLHSSGRAFPETEGCAAAPSGRQSRSFCCAIGGRARLGPLGGHLHRVPPELRGRHAPPRPAPPEASPARGRTNGGACTPLVRRWRRASASLRGLQWGEHQGSARTVRSRAAQVLPFSYCET